MCGVSHGLDLLFGTGDTDYACWLLAVRVNILVFVFCAAAILVWRLSPARLRTTLAPRSAAWTALALTVIAGLLRFVVARVNLMDFGGIAYSRLLLGYKGCFGTAQFFSLFYGLTARDLEHAILFNRIAGTLTIPLVYVLCRRLESETRLLPATAAFLFAVYPLHILFSASDALAVFSGFLAAASYVILAGADGLDERHRIGAIHYLGGFAGLMLLTQIRYENVLLLVPPAVVLIGRRDVLRLREVFPPLAVAAAFAMFYAYEAAMSGLSYQNPIHLWPGVQMVIQHLVLNPFLAIPLLLVGTLAVAVFKGPRLGMLALLPWVAALSLPVLTESGHGAARVYANWLVLLLPFSGYGFSLMMTAPQYVAKVAGGAALLALAAQPVLMRDRVVAQHVEIIEHDRFKELLRTAPPDVQSIIVPDDDLMRRAYHSTIEVYQKYAAIFAATPEAAGRMRLVGLTEYLEHPQQVGCAPRGCVFFFGLPCMEPDLSPFTSAQCQDLLRTHRTSVLNEVTVIAAPFIDCSIYSGTLREQRCDPATTPQRFTVYRIEE